MKAPLRISLLLIIALSMGILLGATFFNAKGTHQYTKYYPKLQEVLSYIESYYVDSVDIEQLGEYAIEKILEKLDPHSTYIPLEEIPLAKADLEGSFEGIGIEYLIVNDTIEIISTIQGGPAQQAGLRAGDKIVSIDGERVAGIGIDHAGVFKRLRGKKGTRVELEILRRKSPEPALFTITRDRIQTRSVYAFMLDEQTGFIKITSFASNTHRDFQAALDRLLKKGMKQLILDLRDNPGGYMDRATSIADEFLPEGQLIVRTDGKGVRFDSVVKATRKGRFEQGKLVVLVNEGSASASEILAGALQDNDRGLIVGRRTFGKGLVQMPIQLHDGSELRLTISRYYTPSGRCIQKPYDGNRQHYKEELASRVQLQQTTDKMQSEPSFEVDSSLRYTTRAGRTVYGGGGIMPDYWVSAQRERDTILSYVYADAFLEESAIEFTQSGQANQWKDAQQLRDNWQLPSAFTQELAHRLKSKGVDWCQLTIQEQQDILYTIHQHMLAMMARQLWGYEAYYLILAQEDSFVKTALGVLLQEEAALGN